MRAFRAIGGAAGLDAGRRGRSRRSSRGRRACSTALSPAATCSIPARRVHRALGARSCRSASPRARCGTRSRRSSRRAGLERHFRFIVASGDTPASKPAPDPYRRAAALHGLPPAAVRGDRGLALGHRVGEGRRPALRRHHADLSAPELPAADAIIDWLDEFTPALIQRSL